MSLKKPMSDVELAAFEASHDFEALLVQPAREMGAGKTRKVYTPVLPRARTQACRKPVLPSCSVCTLQQWEQDRREPTGAAKTLIAIAEKMPAALRAIDPDCKAPRRVVGRAKAKHGRLTK